MLKGHLLKNGPGEKWNWTCACGSALTDCVFWSSIVKQTYEADPGNFASALTWNFKSKALALNAMAPFMFKKKFLKVINQPVNVKVTNTGKMNGEEVVQLYVSNQGKNIHAPLKALKGFKRISLKAGESKMISFQLRPEDLSVPDEQGTIKQLKGKIAISVGGGQPGVANKTTSNVLTKIITVQ